MSTKRKILLAGCIVLGIANGLIVAVKRPVHMLNLSAFLIDALAVYALIATTYERG